MALSFAGNGTIAGLSVGGLPDGTVDEDTLANNAVGSGKLASGVGGKCLQVVHGDLSTAYSRTSCTSTYTTTGLSASITPASSSNSVLVITTVYAMSVTNHNYSALKVFRDSTGIGNPRQISNGDRYGYITPQTIVWKDSPSSSSAITYSVQVADENNDGSTIYVNRGSLGAGSEQICTSSIVLMEISA